MAQLSVAQYDALEGAITHRRRIAVWRRGTEFVVVPTRLVMRNGREELEARQPTTGHPMVLVLDELDRVEVVP